MVVPQLRRRPISGVDRVGREFESLRAHDESAGAARRKAHGEHGCYGSLRGDRAEQSSSFLRPEPLCR